MHTYFMQQIAAARVSDMYTAAVRHQLTCQAQTTRTRRRTSRALTFRRRAYAV